MPIRQASLARLGPRVALPSDRISPGLRRCIPPDSGREHLAGKAQEEAVIIETTNTVLLMLGNRERLEERAEMNGRRDSMCFSKRVWLNEACFTAHSLESMTQLGLYRS